MQHIKIAVVMGGYSDEYLVSLRSGALIAESLAQCGYAVYKAIILQDDWHVITPFGEKYPLQKEDFSFLMNDEKQCFDLCFNTIHGKPGENGQIQAYWDIIGQRYTGCDFYQSALTFNKKDCLAVLSKYGVPSAKSIYLHKNQKYNETEIIHEIGLPCFVKPNQSGSSLGISKVKTPEELAPAIALAFKEDDEVLVEAFLDGTEVSVGVVQLEGKATVLGITEIIPDTEFFDYEAKYNGASQEITPARLTDDVRIKVENIAIKAYQSLGMKGFSRSEFIIVNDTPFMLEMNTNPGFSAASILPQQAKYFGLSTPELCRQEVERALRA